MTPAQLMAVCSGPGVPIWSPTTPGNVVSWFSAGSPYIFEDDAGTDESENFDVVAVWKDRGGADQHIAQTVNSDRPMYRATGWNSSQPTVDFDGAGDVLARTTGTLLSSLQGDDVAFTVFATLQCLAADQDQSIFCWDNSGGNELINIRTDNAGNNLLSIARRDASGSLVTVTGNALTTARRRIAVAFTGTQISAYIDGSIDIFNQSMNTGVLTTINRFRFGNGLTGSFLGRISEFVVYTGDKSGHVGNYQAYSTSVWGG